MTSVDPDINLSDISIYENTGWIVGMRDTMNESVFMKLIDDRWEKTQDVPGRITTIYASDDQNGWAAGENGLIYKVRDNKWSGQETFTNMDIIDIYTRSAGEAWVVASKRELFGTNTGVVYKYENNDWLDVYHSDGLMLYSIETTKDTVIAAGESGLIVFMRDRKWFKLEKKMATYFRYEGIRDIDCLDNNECYLGSDVGELLMIDANGRIININNGNMLHDVDVLSDVYAIAVGDSGIYEYTNGSWKKSGIDIENLFSIVCRGSHNCWVSGDGGIFRWINDDFITIANTPRYSFRNIIITSSNVLAVAGRINRGNGIVESHLVLINGNTQEITKDILINGDIMDIDYDDQNESLYIASSEGLWRLRNNVIEKVLGGSWSSIEVVENDVWIGGRGKIINVSAISPSTYALPVDNMEIYDIDLDGSCGGFAVGDFGYVFMLNGNTWLPVAGPESRERAGSGVPLRVLSVDCMNSNGSQDEVIIVGSEETIAMARSKDLKLRSDGTAPAPTTAMPFTPVPETLTPVASVVPKQKVRLYLPIGYHDMW